jgi:hypothetical protein
MPDNASTLSEVVRALKLDQSNGFDSGALSIQSEESKGLPVPRELRTAPENMNIQIRLVTSGALSAPCPKDCFNWGTQGLPVSPLASSGKTGQLFSRQCLISAQTVQVDFYFSD